MESPPVNSSFDPLNQEIFITLADGITQVPILAGDIDFLTFNSLSVIMNFGTQVGASFMMLIVFVLMTPMAKLSKPANIIHILNLIVCIIRFILLMLTFVGTRATFYADWTGDFQFVTANDERVNVVGISGGIVQVVLVEAALVLQAWALIKLWPEPTKWIVGFLSAAVALSASVLKFVATIYIIYGTLHFGFDDITMTLYQNASILVAVSIFYFCALFNTRLCYHLWSHRGFLPSSKGLSAMEVLVMTNGILMVIPVLFAGLQFGTFQNFEAGSLANTTVILVLPLGSLIAQRVSGGSLSGTQQPYSVNSKASSTPLRNAMSRLTGSRRTRGDASLEATTVESKVEAGASREKMDPVDRELREIDEDLEAGSIGPNRIRVQRAFESHEDRV